MNLLVIGKGGREHALVWKLSRSRRAGTVFCAPGNAGTAIQGVNVPIEPHEFDKLIRFAQKNAVGLTVVGPEDPLTEGIVDAFQKVGLRIFGPMKSAARIEGSKVFAKQLMRHADVPTAEFRVFDHPAPARSYAQSRDYPVVVKADGLAAGKGVIVCRDVAESLQAIDRIMVREEFGIAAGRQVVIEKRLQGAELSLLALVSGRSILPLAPTQDHKAAFDDDKGPNTGGMGAYCPAIVSEELLAHAEQEILVRTVHAMKRGRTPFRGLLYAGLMNTDQGLRVLEFNCRFGDPETQPLLMRLQTDLLDVLEAVVDDRLDELELAWDPRQSVCVVLASQGYPGSFAKGKTISGLTEAANLPDVQIFHAGTKVSNNRILTDGGRVLGVTAIGDTIAKARQAAYAAIEKISFPGMFYRRDIAAKVEAIMPPAPAVAEEASAESE
jgi:phosphoribosylamine--glycine ligase